MNERLAELAEQIRTLQDELRALLDEEAERANFRIEGGRVRFEHSVRRLHRELRIGLLHWLRASEWRNALSAPFIYGMLIPVLALDLSVSLYQAVCFRLYRIPRVPRGDFVAIDRHHLAYLNVMERLNCVYCGYANGVMAYAREIAARTEQYWCPIKHARKVADPHWRYSRFIPYGEADALEARGRALREALRSGSGRPGPGGGPSGDGARSQPDSSSRAR